MALTKVNSILVDGAINTDASGNVGIGTASPSTPLGGAKGLVIDSGANNDAQIRLQSNTTGALSSDGALLSIAGDRSLYLWNYESAPLIFGTNATDRMRINASGNLLINETAPLTTARLYITQTNTGADAISIRNSGATAGRYWSSPFIDTSSTYYIINQNSVGVRLTDGSTSWAAQSDARLKNVTGTYTNALSDIAKIEPVKFTWKDDSTNKPQVGVLAQSVLPVVPEAVDALVNPRSEDTTEYLNVRYTELIPLVIAAIQEQQAIITDLKARIETLEAK